MFAVLLVAGTSSRLRPLTDDQPKCLVKVAGTPILRLAVDALVGAGIHELVVVTGYHADQVRTALHRWHPDGVTYRHNPRYEQTQTAASLLAAHDLVDGEPFVLVDGDLVFDSEVLEAVVWSVHADCAVVHPTTGAPIGIVKVSAATSRLWFATLEDRIARHGARTESYRDALDQLVAEGRLALHPIDIGTHYCAAIATVADLARVEHDLAARGAN